MSPPLFRIRLIAAVALLVSFSMQSSAQDKSPEELIAEIENDDIHDTLRVYSFFSLANHYYYSNTDTTFILCQDALDLSIEINYKAGIIEGYGWLGLLYNMMGESDLALENFNYSLEMAIQENDMFAISQSLNDLATVYLNLGQIEKSLAYYIKCLKVREQMGDEKGVATVLNNLGTIYKNQGDNEVALQKYESSLEIQRELNNEIGISVALGNIGSCHSALGNDSLALKYFNESLVIDSTLNNVVGLANCYNNLGALRSKQKNPELALELYLKAYEYSYAARSREGVANTATSIGRLYLAKENYGLAKEYAETAHKQALKIGFPENISRSSKLLSKIYVKEGDANLAVEMYQLHIEMRDSLNNLSTQKATQKSLAQQAYEKQKILDDTANEKLLLQEQAEKERKTVINYALGGGSVLLVLFLLYVYTRLKSTKKQKEIISNQHDLLEETHKEITDSIVYAQRIQKAILPPARIVNSLLPNSFVLYLPKDVVAGDFYWMEKVNDTVIFAAADCTGHGVPGAMVSVICNNALNRSVREFGLTDPGEILSKTREIVISEFEKSDEEVKDGMDIALCSLSGNSLKYAGANNPLWVKKENGEYREIKANKQPIGKFEKATPFTSHELELESGDIIYLSSDGYADQFGGVKGKKLKQKGLKSIIDGMHKEPLSNQKDILTHQFNEWKGSLEQLDDVCIIGVKI
jgi:serine phosphatase RsbU (regulator of sigma subunit)